MSAGSLSAVALLICLSVGGGLIYFWSPGPATGISRLAAVGKSDFRRAADRIAVIRGGGSQADGIHLLSMPVKISDNDYLLMGCDNSSAKRNYPDVPRDQREEGRWFAGADDLTHSFGNSHGTQRKDGTWAVDAFYTSLPRPQYQANPEEVAWHYVRVRELRAQNVPVEQRLATMNAEAKNKPWLTMQ